LGFESRRNLGKTASTQDGQPSNRGQADPERTVGGTVDADRGPVRRRTGGAFLLRYRYWRRKYWDAEQKFLQAKKGGGERVDQPGRGPKALQKQLQTICARDGVGTGEGLNRS